jgi:hypothetical protein
VAKFGRGNNVNRAFPHTTCPIATSPGTTNMTTELANRSGPARQRVPLGLFMNASTAWCGGQFACELFSLQRFDCLHCLHPRLFLHGLDLSACSSIHHVSYHQRLASIVVILDAAPSGLILTVAPAATTMITAIFVLSGPRSAVVTSVSRSAFTATSRQTGTTSVSTCRAPSSNIAPVSSAVQDILAVCSSTHYCEIHHFPRSW